MGKKEPKFAHGIIAQCYHALYEAMTEEKEADYYAHYAFVSVKCNDGQIDLCAYKDIREALVIHSGLDSECLTLAGAIEKVLPSWDEIPGEPYPVGDPLLDDAFASWEDYYGWKY